MLYHYTTGHNFVKIIQSHALLPMPLGNELEGEKVAVWFSSNDYWEPTAQKAIKNTVMDEWHLLGMKGTAKLGGGLFRFKVSRENSKIMGFNDFARTSNLPERFISGLKKEGRKQGGRYYQWFASYDPVASEDWLGIETWKDDKWVPID